MKKEKRSGQLDQLKEFQSAQQHPHPNIMDKQPARKVRRTKFYNSYRVGYVVTDKGQHFGHSSLWHLTGITIFHILEIQSC